ncbi:MAG: threonine ammonia-lyase [Acidimicrobiales bacterium]|jgi:threonine dehydratase
MTAGASTPLGIDLEAVEAVRPAVGRLALRTPLQDCHVLSELTGSHVLLKAENLQRTGSFKIRGAAAKVAALGAGASPGVVVASAGNHAQAVAFAARAAGVPCEVYMPAEASISKADATIEYGASVHLEGDSLDDCVLLAEARARATGLHFVHPFDDPAIVAGQGTLGLELVEDVDDLAMVVVPLGGGGLVSGVGCVIDALSPKVKVVAVQAAVCAPYLAARDADGVTATMGSTTLADGIAVKRPSGMTLGMVERHVDDIVAVGENEIADAIVMMLMRSKLVVEGAGAVGVAALSEGLIAPPASGTTVVVLSGGNIDTGLLAPVIRRQETNAGRRVVLLARITDRPGSLARLLTCISESGANLLTVEHLREGYELQVRETGVHIVLETRNREHAKAVLDAARAAGFDVRPVGSSVA